MNNETKFTTWRVTEYKTERQVVVIYKIESGPSDCATIICERITTGESPGTLATFRQIVRDHNAQPELIAALKAFEQIYSMWRSDEHNTYESLDEALDIFMPQARAAIAKATGSSALNWIVTYNGEPIRRLMFEGTKASIIVGTVADAIRYSPEEAAEVATAIRRGAEVVNATEGDK